MRRLVVVIAGLLALFSLIRAYTDEQDLQRKAAEVVSPVTGQTL